MIPFYSPKELLAHGLQSVKSAATRTARGGYNLVERRINPPPPKERLDKREIKQICLRPSPRGEAPEHPVENTNPHLAALASQLHAFVTKMAGSKGPFIRNGVAIAERIVPYREIALRVANRIEDLVERNTPEQSGAGSRVLDRVTLLLQKYQNAREMVEGHSGNIEAWKDALNASGIEWNPCLEDLRASPEPERFLLNCAADLIKKVKEVLLPEGLGQTGERAFDLLLTQQLSNDRAILAFLEPDLLDSCAPTIQTAMTGVNFQSQQQSLRQWLIGSLDRPGLHSPSRDRSVVLNGELVEAVSSDLLNQGMRPGMSWEDAQQHYIEHYLGGKNLGRRLDHPEDDTVLWALVGDTHYVVGITPQMQAGGIRVGMSMEAARERYPAGFNEMDATVWCPNIPALNVVPIPPVPETHPLYEAAVNTIVIGSMDNVTVVRGTTPLMQHIGITPGMLLEEAQRLHANHAPNLDQRLTILDLRSDAAPDVLKEAYPHLDGLDLEQKFADYLKTQMLKPLQPLKARVDQLHAKIKNMIESVPLVGSRLYQVAEWIVKIAFIVATWPLRFVFRQYALHYLGTTSIDVLTRRMAKNALKDLKSPAVGMLAANLIGHFQEDLLAGERGVGTAEDPACLGQPLLELRNIAIRWIQPDAKLKSPNLTRRTVDTTNWIGRKIIRFNAMVFNTGVMRKLGSWAGSTVHYCGMKLLDSWLAEKIVGNRPRALKQKIEQHAQHIQEGLHIASVTLRLAAEKTMSIQTVHKIATAALPLANRLGYIHGDFSRFERKGANDLPTLIHEAAILGISSKLEWDLQEEIGKQKRHQAQIDQLALQEPNGDAFQRHVASARETLGKQIQSIDRILRSHEDALRVLPGYTVDLATTLRELERNLTPRPLPENLIRELHRVIPPDTEENRNLRRRLDEAFINLKTKCTLVEREQRWSTLLNIAYEACERVPERVRRHHTILIHGRTSETDRLNRLRGDQAALSPQDFREGVTRNTATALMNGIGDAPEISLQQIEARIHEVNNRIGLAQDRILPIQELYTEIELDGIEQLGNEQLLHAVGRYREHGPEWVIGDLNTALQEANQQTGAELVQLRTTRNHLIADRTTHRNTQALRQLAEVEIAAVEDEIQRFDQRIQNTTNLLERINLGFTAIRNIIAPLSRTKSNRLLTRIGSINDLLQARIEALKASIIASNRPFHDLLDLQNELDYAKDIRSSLTAAIAGYRRALAHKRTTGMEIENCLDALTSAANAGGVWASNHALRCEVREGRIAKLTQKLANLRASLQRLNADPTAATDILKAESAKKIKRLNELRSSPHQQAVVRTLEQQLESLQHRINRVAERVMTSIHARAASPVVKPELDSAYQAKRIRRARWKQYVDSGHAWLSFSKYKSLLQKGKNYVAGNSQRNYAREALSELPQTTPELQEWRKLTQEKRELRQKLHSANAKLYMANFRNPIWWLENRHVAKPAAIYLHGKVVRSSVNAPVNAQAR